MPITERILIKSSNIAIHRGTFIKEWPEQTFKFQIVEIKIQDKSVCIQRDEQKTGRYILWISWEKNWNNLKTTKKTSGSRTLRKQVLRTLSSCLTFESAATLCASSASTSGKVSAFLKVCCSFCSASSSRSCNCLFLSSLYTGLWSAMFSVKTVIRGR